MQGYFIISRPWEKHWCLRIFAALSFPFPRFNLKTLNVNDHLQVTWLIFQQWICHILLRPLSSNCLPSFMTTDQNNPFKCHFAKLCKLGGDPCPNMPETISRVIICHKPVHDKSGDPARTQRNQENGKENRRPQQDDQRKITSTQVYTFASK